MNERRRETESIARRYRDCRGGALRLESLENRCVPATFIVATNGDDSGPGSLTQPFASIQHALDVANPGDTIQVRAGTYNEAVAFPRSGNSSTETITLKAFAGEPPVISAAGLAEQYVVLIEDRSFVQVQGFEIRDAVGGPNGDDASGIRVQGSGSNVKLVDNKIHEIRGTGAMGISVYGTSLTTPLSAITVEGNEIFDCEPAESEALTLNGNISGFEIKNNRVHDVNYIGIDMIGGEFEIFGLAQAQPNLPVARNGTVTGNIVFNAREQSTGQHRAVGIYVDGGQDITISGNTVSSSDLGIEVAAENPGYTASGVVVENNIIHDNDGPGLAFGGFEGNVGRTENCRFVNNTIVNNDLLGFGGCQVQLQFASNNLFTNNIVVASGNNVLLGDAGPNSSSNNVFDHNLYGAPGGAAAAIFNLNDQTFTGFTAWQGTGQDANSLFGDPQFVDIAAADYSLSANSPAIDAGSTQAGEFATTDFNGISRPQGGGPDIGAFENSVASVLRQDGAQLLLEPPSPESAQNAAFSPDGRTLLFTVFHSGYNIGPAGLFTLPVGGQSRTALLDEPGQDSVNLPGTSWNPATNRIVFSSDRQDIDEIWAMAANGTDLVRVTRHTTGEFFREPSFSPDGQWIVLEVLNNVPEPQQQGSIWKVRADGTELTKLTDGPALGRDDRQPNWSPTGDRILFQRRLPGSDDWNIFTMKPDGTDIRQVSTDPASDTDASWSPDGQRITYSSNHGGLSLASIFVISASGGTPIRVTSDAVHEDGAPSWSPDGLWIAFESHTTADPNSRSGLWRIGAPESGHFGPIAIGGADGSVRVNDAATGAEILTFRPLDAGSKYAAPVAVALGDVDDDGIPELFVAAQKRAGTAGLDSSKAGRVFVFDGADLLDSTATLVDTIVPFATPYNQQPNPDGTTAYQTGFELATGDVNDDGTLDLISTSRGDVGMLVVHSTATGHAQIGATTNPNGAATPYGTNYRGKLAVAAGNFIGGDAGDEIATTRGNTDAVVDAGGSIVIPATTTKIALFDLVGGVLTKVATSGAITTDGTPSGIVANDGSLIDRNSFVVAVDPDGNGVDQLIFAARDIPLNQVRVVTYDIAAGGVATIAAVGSANFLVGNRVGSYAVSTRDSDANSTRDALVLVNDALSGGTDGILFLNPLTGGQIGGTIAVTIPSGGVRLATR